jgi:uncharacterized protein DUF6249
MPGIPEIFIVLIVFMAPAMPILIIGMVYFYKKKLEHKQVLAAIEKGVPISELNIRKAKEEDQTTGPGWVKDITKGITCLIIAVGIGILLYCSIFLHRGPVQSSFLWIIPIIFLAKGIGLVIRGMMRRKYEKQPEEPLDENTSNELPLPAEG